MSNLKIKMMNELEKEDMMDEALDRYKCICGVNENANQEQYNKLCDFMQEHSIDLVTDIATLKLLLLNILLGDVEQEMEKVKSN